MKSSILLLIVCTTTTLFGQGQQLYKNPSEPVEERVRDLLSQMTQEEKVDMLGGYHGFSILPNARLGIPEVRMADGPLGVRNDGQATAFPAGILFTSTWNTDLEKRYGEAIADEACAKTKNIILAPGLNIYRAPMCGRNFEYFGEDPFLASRMAVSYVEGVQSKGVVATVKHFAANNQEYNRHRGSSDVDERTLREIYLPAFEAAVTEAHVGAVMNSYNLLNGIHCSENRHLLTEILKNDWKFDGFVMSDWGSTYDGVAAANAGMDLEMPSGEFMNRKTFIPALQDGRLTQSTIDDKVRRMLRIMFRFGFFDQARVDSSILRYNPDSRLVALQAAREGIVLLKNTGNTLPLNAKAIKSIAVLGPNAHPAVFGGSGSSQMQPFRTVSMLDGIIARAGDNVRVYYASNLSMSVDDIVRASEYGSPKEDGTIVPGLRGEYFRNMNLSGTPALTRIDRRINFSWGDGSPGTELPADSFSVRWTGGIFVESPGAYEFVVRGDDGYRLMVDGTQLIDNWTDEAATATFATRQLTGGNHTVTIEYYEHEGDAELAFGWHKKETKTDAEAVRLASRADAAVVCVGFNPVTEGEGFDRPFALPKEQEDLIREVAAVNAQTIVVLNAGGNVAMTGWIDSVVALLHAWYPGQEGGTAVAEILFGDVNPSGKLPVSFEKQWEDNATFSSYYDDDKDGHVRYSEGVFLGYRHFDKDNIKPMFPFGFGLSYTSFVYSNLNVMPGDLARGESATVRFAVKNTGKKSGSEIAEVYVHPVKTTVSRPVKELKGFSKVWLRPGESKTVGVILNPRAFAYFDTTQHAWIAEQGAYEILIGSSSADIRLKGSVAVKEKEVIGYK